MAIITITFNAFGFLQRKLKEENIDPCNLPLQIKEQETPEDIMTRFKLAEEEVEAVFVNGKIAPLDTPLRDGDRVAFVPPGTPGPYRVLLGIRKIAEKKEDISS